MMNPTSSPRESKQEPALLPHRWLDCMDKSADMIQNVWAWAIDQKMLQQSDLQDPVEVALIDDGVDFHHPRLRGKNLNGRTFDYGRKRESEIRHHWFSTGGHGTVMASMISRVCPMARMYVIRLETHIDHKGKKARIGARSAAEVNLSSPYQSLHNSFLMLMQSTRLSTPRLTER